MYVGMYVCMSNFRRTFCASADDNTTRRVVHSVLEVTCIHTLFTSHFQRSMFAMARDRELSCYCSLLCNVRRKPLPKLFFVYHVIRVIVYYIHLGLIVLVTATAIYSLGHGLRTFTAVPRLTQPFTLRRTVNEYQLTG